MLKQQLSTSGPQMVAPKSSKGLHRYIFYIHRAFLQILEQEGKNVPKSNEYYKKKEKKKIQEAMKGGSGASDYNSVVLVRFGWQGTISKPPKCSCGNVLRNVPAGTSSPISLRNVPARHNVPARNAPTPTARTLATSCEVGSEQCID